MTEQPDTPHPDSAMEPMARLSSKSDIGRQLTPPLVECQTPPFAVPSHTSSAFDGFTAITVARPLTSTREPNVWPPATGAGPIGSQVIPLILDCAKSETPTKNTAAVALVSDLVPIGHISY